MTLEPEKILSKVIKNWNSLPSPEKRSHISNFKKLLFPYSNHHFQSFESMYGSSNNPKQLTSINIQHVKKIREVYKIDVLNM